jgi:hypothetical protein
LPKVAAEFRAAVSGACAVAFVVERVDLNALFGSVRDIS